GGPGLRASDRVASAATCAVEMGGPELAPHTPQSFGPPRRSRGGPLSCARSSGPELARHTPQSFGPPRRSRGGPLRARGARAPKWPPALLLSDPVSHIPRHRTSAACHGELNVRGP